MNAGAGYNQHRVAAARLLICDEPARELKRPRSNISKIERAPARWKPLCIQIRFVGSKQI